MESMIVVNWPEFDAWTFVQVSILLAFVVVGGQLTKQLAKQTNADLKQLRQTKSALVALVKNYWLGWAGSSVIMYAALGFAGYTLDAREALIISFCLWTYFLIADRIGGSNEEGQQKGSV